MKHGNARPVESGSWQSSPVFSGGLIEARCSADETALATDLPPYSAGASLKRLAEAHKTALVGIFPRIQRGPQV